MERQQIIDLVKWTMTYYGSDAGERTSPGSKLQYQAEHIANVIEQYNEARQRISGLEHVSICLSHSYK